MSAINTQPVEPADLHADGSVDFHSMFLTLQGEGPFAGHRALFIRLAGCNLQCPGCDTEYTYGRQRLSVPQIVERAERLLEQHELPLFGMLVVLTGGEPFRQAIGPLCWHLADLGCRIQIESNGVLEACSQVKQLVDYGFASVVVSPKTSRVHPSWGDYAMAFKYVLERKHQDPDDGLPTLALGHKASPRVARPPQGYKGQVYLNPMDCKDDWINARNAEAVAKAALQYGYIAGVQMHKIFNLE